MKTIEAWIAQVPWQTLAIAAAEIILIIIGARILLTVLHKVVNSTETRIVKSRQKEGDVGEVEKRLSTLFKLIWQGISLTVWLLTAVIILDKLGVQIGPSWLVPEFWGWRLDLAPRIW